MPHTKVFGMLPEVRRYVELSLLLFAGLAIMASILLVRRDVLSSQRAVHPPFSFVGEWRSDKPVYKAGELARFTYTRAVRLDGKGLNGKAEDPVALLGIDVFENNTTNEVFPGAILARVVDQEGTRTLHSVRRIPRDITPGQYVLAGWISAQTPRRSLPAAYRSNVFTIEAPDARPWQRNPTPSVCIPSPSPAPAD